MIHLWLISVSICALWLQVSARSVSRNHLPSLLQVNDLSEPYLTYEEQCKSVDTSIESRLKLSVSKAIQLRGGKKKKSAGMVQQIINQIKSIVRSFLPGGKTAKKAANRYGSPKKRSSSSSISGSKYSSDDSGNNRLQKEIQSFMESPPDNCKLLIGKNIRVWVVTLTGVEGTIYAGETFKLKLVFPKEYPSKPPSVFFLKPVPKHMHVYTNGDICLNFLGRDWRPTMTGQMLAVSILSMLSSAREKKIPQDNALHADSQPGLQQDNWMYHDDRC